MNLASLKKSSKIIGLGFLVVILLAASIVGGKGAMSLLSKASSCGIDKVSAVQVGANSAVITWESSDVSTGRVEYGTSATNLNFSAPEGASGKTHNLPLTLLTPNTVYYYLVAVGNNKCDSSGQACKEDTCVPWSFTTAAVTPQQQIVAPILTPTPATPSATLVASPSASPTAGASTFCDKVKANVGANSKDTANWDAVKQYDVDGNGIINVLDVLKCPKS